jgi:hypothetical protein
MTARTWLGVLVQTVICIALVILGFSVYHHVLKDAPCEEVRS